MYMKCTKKELAKMLIESNKVITNYIAFGHENKHPQKVETTTTPDHGISDYDFCKMIGF